MNKFFKRSSPDEKKAEPDIAPVLAVDKAPQSPSGQGEPAQPEQPNPPENPLPPSQPSPAASEPPAAPPTGPAFLRSGGLLYQLFSSETRTGRVMRPVLRWLAAITGLFALGLLAGYFWLYQPAQRDLDAATLKLAEMTQSLNQKDKSQVSTETDRDQAVKALQQAQADLKKAASENDLLVVLSGVHSARVALVNKDGPSAKTLIEQAQTDLSRAAGYIETQDKNRSDLLKTRLDLAAKELVSDPQAAQADLDRLAADLNDLRLKLFKK